MPDRTNIRALDLGGSGLKTAEFTPDGALVDGSVERFESPDWQNIEAWIGDRIPLGAQPVGIACAGLVDAGEGLVKLFRTGGWHEKPLRADMERHFPAREWRC